MPEEVCRMMRTRRQMRLISSDAGIIKSNDIIILRMYISKYLSLALDPEMLFLHYNVGVLRIRDRMGRLGMYPADATEARVSIRWVHT